MCFFDREPPQVCLVDTDHIHVIKLPPFLHTAKLDGGKKPRNVASARLLGGSGIMPPPEKFGFLTF